MGYRIMGRAHAAALWARGRVAGAAGEGTVEYVKGKGIADAVTEKIRSTIEGVAAKKG